MINKIVHTRIEQLADDSLSTYLLLIQINMMIYFIPAGENSLEKRISIGLFHKLTNLVFENECSLVSYASRDGAISSAT